MIKPEQLIASFQRGLPPHPAVRAAWLGGSQAFHRNDQWSDIDLQIVTAPGREDEVFAHVEFLLTSLSPIASILPFPPPAWHGGSQKFYRLEDASEFTLVDALVFSDPAKASAFLAPAQHGTPFILADKEGLLVPPLPDWEALRARILKRLARLKLQFPLFQSLTKKEVLRGRFLDALGFYQSHTLAPLVEVLRMRYCPAKFDFHLRYTQFDLPKSVHMELEHLYKVASLEDIKTKRDKAETWFKATLIHLERQGITLPPA